MKHFTLVAFNALGNISSWSGNVHFSLVTNHDFLNKPRLISMKMKYLCPARNYLYRKYPKS